MQFQIGVNTTNVPPPPVPAVSDADAVPILLTQILELQREQYRQILEVQTAHLNHARATIPDHLARLRALLSRWEIDHPDIARNCMNAYPQVEKTYVQILSELVGELADQDQDALANDYAAQELLDRYGTKLGQLGQLLNIIGPLSEAARQNDAARPQSL